MIITPPEFKPTRIYSKEHALPPPEQCPRCASDVYIDHNSYVYRKSFGDWPWLYNCRTCKARVGMFKNTNTPYGIMSTPELSAKRAQAKKPFDRIIASGVLSLDAAYKELAERLDIKLYNCSFARFDEPTVEKAQIEVMDMFIKYGKNKVI